MPVLKFDAMSAVSLRVEDDLAIRSALRHMMGKSGQDPSGCSRHTLVKCRQRNIFLMLFAGGTIQAVPDYPITD